MKKYSIIFFFSLLLTLSFVFKVSDASAQGCVMCRAQVGENKDKEQAELVGTGLNTGILYLMAVPYLLIGTIGLIWYMQSKKKSVA